MYLKRLSQFYHHPLRLGPAPHAPHGAVPAIGPPQAIVTIGSIPAILRLASDPLSPSLVAAAACLPSARARSLSGNPYPGPSMSDQSVQVESIRAKCSFEPIPGP